MKEITFQLITQGDDSIKPKVKESETEFSQDELYMLYKYIELILNATEFDWSKEGFFQSDIRSS